MILCEHARTAGYRGPCCTDCHATSLSQMAARGYDVETCCKVQRWLLNERGRLEKASEAANGVLVEQGENEA